MKNNFCWLIIVFSMFLIGIFLGEVVVLIRCNEKNSEFLENINLFKVRWLRWSYGEIGDIKFLEMMILSYDEMFIEFYSDVEDDLIDLNYNMLWYNGLEILIRLVICDFDDFSIVNGLYFYYVVDFVIIEEFELEFLLLF